MKTCPSCSAETDDKQTYCLHCGEVLLKDPDDSAILEEAYNYPPLIKVLRWSIWLQVAGMAVGVLIGAYALLTQSDVFVISMAAIVLWVVVALVLAIGMLIVKWQNAAMLTSTHPSICSTLKGLFWIQIAMNVGHTFLRRITPINQYPLVSAAVALTLTGLGFWLQYRRDKVIAGRFPSKVTILEWVAGGVGFVIVGVVVAALALKR